MPWNVSDGKVFYYAKRKKDLPKLEGCNEAYVHNMPTPDQIKMYEDLGFEVVVNNGPIDVLELFGLGNRRP